MDLFALFNEYKVKLKKITKPIDITCKILGRMYVIQATSYISQCYTLIDSMDLTMVFIIFVLMTTANWPKETTFESAMAFTVIICSFLVSLAYGAIS